MSLTDKELTEDQQMFYEQVVCGKCMNRFTTIEDCQLHISIFHEGQPTPAQILEILEQILITVSKD